MSTNDKETQDIQDHVEHLHHEQEHLKWQADHMRALAVLRRVEAHLYQHEAEIAIHRAEIAQHEETLEHGTSHTPAPPTTAHASASIQHKESATGHGKLVEAILALDKLL